eukprot:433850-Amphidinium_carterae.2
MRPISVLPLVWRVFTRVLYAQISAKTDSAMMQSSQYGGRPSRSTGDAISEVRLWMDKRLRCKRACIAQIDLTKYFNCIAPEVLGPFLRRAAVCSAWSS